MMNPETSSFAPQVQELTFEQPVLSIGRHPDNDIVLLDEQALPFHATVIVEEDRFQLIPAEPGAPLRIDGQAVDGPQTAFHSHQTLEIGSCSLFFQRQPTPYGVHVTWFRSGQQATDILPESQSETILLNVLAGEADVAVEQSAYFEVEVVNAGPLVARFLVSLRGVPADWVEITPGTLNLNEGRGQRVTIRVTPPRSPDSEAGTHRLQVVVTSPNYPGQRATADLSLTIQPFYDFAASNLSPKNQRIPWRKHNGLVYLPLKNLSNTAADFLLTANDDENGCTFDFLLDEDVQLSKQASLRLQRYESIDLPIQVTPLRQPMFALRSKRYHYAVNVQIPQQAAAPHILSGTVLSQPLFGWWSIVLGVMALLLGLFFLLQPRIYTFTVAAGKDVIEQGDTTKLVWDTSPFTTRLSLSNVDPPITRDQVSRTIAPERSTTYELVAGNWLSGLFGLDQKRTVTVLVIPPSPHINAFSVDRTTISKGQTVRVRWSVSDAQEALLTIDDVVYQLSPEEFSGEREVLLEDDALITLEARNASGNELQSYFVNVVPPSIQINTFAVWVRSDDVAYNSLQEEMAARRNGGKLLSMIYAPDPNFPVKFVELVPDPNSDTGYSVWFNPNVREELQKGEQIILEWNIEGADSVQIAPFTDVLPSRGSQPFFPQESMNFVLTAQNGDLEAIYMLPVRVFDGEPPKAPTIEFFTASPSKMVGAGDVQFAWSISGEWSRVQISSGEEIIADYLNPQGFKTVHVSKTSSFILTAWNGEDLSSAKIIEVIVDPALKPLDLTITDILPNVNYFKVGDSVDVFISIKDPETGEAPNPFPTGTVTISDGRAICTIVLPTRMCKLVFNASGTKTGDDGIKASYIGDSIYLPADSEPFSDRTIIVESNQVELNPTYYHLDKNGDLAGQINNLGNPSPPLSVGRGMRIQVNVTPVNQPLTPGEPGGRVTVRYCPVENGDIQMQDCTSLLPAAVTVTSPALGVAVVDIQHFSKVGKYALLIDYSHDANAYDPVSIGSDGSLQFDVLPGELMLLPDGLDPCDDNQCTMLQNQAEYIFIPYLDVESGWSEILASTYPEPAPLTIEVTPANAAVENWSSDCQWQKSGDHWILYCDNVNLTEDSTFAYSFSQPDDNYTINHSSIALKVKLETEIAFPSPSFLDNRYVGSEIPLQDPDNVILQEAANHTPIDGTILLTMDKDGSSVSQILDYLIITGNSPTCTANGATLSLPQSQSTTNACHIAFKYAGDYTLHFNYDGNTTYDSAAADQSVVIQQQTGITATASPADFNWMVFTDQLHTWTFSCPSAVSSCQDFVTDSAAVDAIFNGASMQVALSDFPACTVRQGGATLTNGAFTLASSQVDLTFRCSEVGQGTLQLSFTAPSDQDFSLNVGGSTQNTSVSPLPKTTNPIIQIKEPPNTNPAYQVIGSPSDPIDDTELWVGEEYQVVVTIDGMPTDADIGSDYIRMTMPLALKNALSTNSTETTCSWVEDTISGTSVFSIPLNKQTGNDTVWEAVCKFVPAETAALQPNDVISFEFVTSRFSEQAADLDIELPNAVQKHTPTITITVDPTQSPDPNIYALTNPVAKITITDNHKRFNALDTWTTDLIVTINGKTLSNSTDCRQVNDVIECDIDDDTVGSRAINASYTENNVFAGASVDQTITISPVPVALTNVVGSFYETAQCQYLDCVSLNKWPYGGANVSFAGQTYSLTFNLASEISAVTANVEGNVIVSFLYSFNTFGFSCNSIQVLNNSAVLISASNSRCDFRVPINTQQQAVFSWQFTTPNLDISYIYAYDNDNNSVPFTQGSTGWPAAEEDFEIYHKATFNVQSATCGLEKGFKFEILSGPPTLVGYIVNTEVDPNANLTPSVFECENGPPCWGNSDDRIFGPSPNDDGCLQTEPNWDTVLNSNAPYQIIIRSITPSDAILGWQRNP